MLSFRTETFKIKFDVNNDIADSFKYPLVYYLTHVDDVTALFITVVIVDFKNKEMKMIVSFFADNILSSESLVKKGLFCWKGLYNNPHCSFEVSKVGSMLIFVENGYYFYRLDYLDNKMFLYTMDDLSNMVNEKIANISCTVYKDKDDEDFFYSSAISKNEMFENDLLFFRHKCDLSSHELLHKISGENCKIPHVTKKIKNYLLNSEFYSAEVVHNGITMSSKDFMVFVLKDLYKEYCLLNGTHFEEKEFFKKNRIIPNDVLLEVGFYKFCALKGGLFLDICKKNKKYSFTPKPGKISVLNLETKKLTRYETSTVTPAHFEIDEDASIIYASSHNFIIFDTQSYIGPAHIDKFVLLKDGLKKIGTFTHPSGYRFTTHKIFIYNDRKYLCTFGHPNRLFFIDAETMKLVYYDDIGDDFLSNQKDIPSLVTRMTSLGEPVIINIECSDDGRYLFFTGSKFLFIYDFVGKKIAQKIEHCFDFELTKGINLKDFRRRSTHIHYLK